MLLLFVVSAYSQSSQKVDGNHVNEAMKDAISAPDATKIKLLLGIADVAMLKYYDGRAQNNLDALLKLMNTIAFTSNKINYTHGYKRYQLLKSRLLYVQGQDILASELHKQAIDFYKHAPIIDVADAFNYLSESWKFKTHSKEIKVEDSIYYNQTLEYFKAAKQYKKEASLTRSIAFIKIVKGQPQKAISELQNLYKFQVQINDSSRHKTSDFLAHCNAISGNFEEAFYWYQKSLNYATEVQDSLNMNLYNYRAGTINYNVKAFERGTTYLEKALALSQLHSDTGMYISFMLIMCNDGLMEQGKYLEAQNKILATLKKYSGGLNNDMRLNCDIYRCLANCYFYTKQYALAEKYYLQTLHIAEKILNTPENKIPIYNDIAAFYLQQKKINLASEYFNKSLSISESTHSLPAIRDIHLQLFKIDSIEGNFQSAIEHYKKYKAATDSMFSESKSKQIQELEIQYQTQQKEKELLLLFNQSKLQQTSIEQGKILRNAIMGAGALLLLLLLVVFNRYRFKQKANKDLQVQQEKINQQNISLEQLVVEEKKLLLDKDKLLEEKEWLMKEIHHRVKNNLQIVMSLLNSQSTYLKDSTALAAIKESQHRIHAISLIHQKLYQSDNLAAVDMESYIKDVTEYLADNLDPLHYIKFKVNIAPLHLDVAKAVPLGLIINEAVTNAVKYAFNNKTNAEIFIEMHFESTGDIVLVISDNGIGLVENFDCENIDTLGMSLMKGLCKQLDGELEIINKNGVAIKIKFRQNFAS